MSAPYSLTNPPQAPKKVGLAERRGHKVPKLVLPDDERKPTLPEWRALADSGWVQTKYLRYNPEDIEEIDDIDMLLQLQKWYFPSSQPRNLFEETYLKLVLEAVNAKLYRL